MKVLITGAYGFLGRYAAREFKLQGCHVIGIGHGRWYQEEFIKWGIDEWIESTITFEALINSNHIFDVIVHCGGSGSVGFSKINPFEDFQKSVQSTLAILEYIRLRCPGCKLIYPSSVSVQGNLSDMPIKEDVIADPISPYGFHKKIAEELCKSYTINYGLKVGVIRFFSIYGEGLQKQLLYDACKKIFFSAKEKEVIFFGTGKETRDWIYVTDAASLIYKMAVKVDNFDIINGGTAIRVEIAEILEMVKKEYGSSVQIKFDGSVREGDPIYFWSDMSKAKNYDWKPRISLSEGIKMYVRYFKQLYK